MRALSDRRLEWQPSDGWEPLCDALGVTGPDEPFPHANVRSEFDERISTALAPGAAWPVSAVTGLAILLLAGGIFLLATLAVNYRKRWAPIRQVRWVDKPRSQADELEDLDDFKGFD